jgi:hypothetical protein
MIICLLSTIIIECIIAFFLKVRTKKDFINIILVNILTNPLLVSTTLTIRYLIGFKAEKIATIILEILAFIIEGLVYKKVLEYKKIKGITLSLILNISSYTIGILINQLIW